MVYQKIDIATGGTASFRGYAGLTSGFNLTEFIDDAIVAMVRAFAYHRTVAELSALDEDQLRDIGVERADIPQTADDAVRQIVMMSGSA